MRPFCTRALGAAAVLAVVSAVTLISASAGCGDSDPRYSLRQVMFEVEAGRRAVERELVRPSAPDALAAAAERIARWMSDPAFERSLERGDLRGDPARFQSLREAFAAALGPFLAAARVGDPEAARAAYSAVQAACNDCHAVFRPELLIPAPR